MNKFAALKALENLFDASEKNAGTLAEYYSLKEYLEREKEKEVVLLRPRGAKECND